MIKVLSLVFMVAVCAEADGTDRQKRLLFYDEEGNLIKVHSNPYLQNLRQIPGHLPVYGSFLNPFFGFIRDFAFTIPVSDSVIQRIQRNPNYQQKLIVSKRDGVVEPNALCQGIRGQIPSPSSCPSYLNCWDGWGVEQECPKGLLFSSSGYCDFSDTVDCGVRKYTDSYPNEPRCRHDFDSFMNKQDCNEFFVCVGRQPVKFNCPTDLFYSERLGVCDYPTRVNCPSAVNTGVIFPDPDDPTKPAIGSPLPSAPIPSAPVIQPSPIIPPASIAPSVPAAPVSPINPSSPTAPAGDTIPSIPSIPSIPISQSVPVAPSIPSTPIQSELPSLPNGFDPNGIHAVFSENSVTNTQSWKSTHVAISRQDALRQLQQQNIKINI